MAVLRLDAADLFKMLTGIVESLYNRSLATMADHIAQIQAIELGIKAAA